MDVLQANIHRAHRDGEVLKLREQVEQVVRGECQLGWFHVLRGELQGAKGEGGGQGR